MIKDMGNTNMSDPKTLTNYIVEMTKKFPAEHFALILADHGAGWKGALSDDTSEDSMSTPNIRKAIEDAEKITGVKIDIVGFDACLMATGEVATELKNAAKYMVASQESEGGAGWNYTPLLNSRTLKSFDRALRSRLNISPKDFAIKMIDNAQMDQESIPTLSAFDLSKIDKYEESVNKFSQAILDTNTPNKVLTTIAKKTQDFSFMSSKDQYHFAELITKSTDIKDESLKKAAQDLMNTIIKELIIKEEHSDRCPDAHGVTAEIPDRSGIKDPKYQDLLFAKETLWDEAVNKMYK
jgi:hypothetical protein